MIDYIMGLTRRAFEVCVTTGWGSILAFRRAYIGEGASSEEDDGEEVHP